MDNIQSFLDLSEEYFNSTSYYKQSKFDPRRLTSLVDRLNGMYTGFVETLEKNGKVVGLFLGVVTPVMFADGLEGQVLFYYVHPDHRGSTWFIKTLKKFEQFTLAQGGKYIIATVGSAIMPEKQLKMYTRMGYEDTGNRFYKEL